MTRNVSYLRNFKDFSYALCSLTHNSISFCTCFKMFSPWQKLQKFLECQSSLAFKVPCQSENSTQVFLIYLSLVLSVCSCFCFFDPYPFLSFTLLKVFVMPLHILVLWHRLRAWTSKRYPYRNTPMIDLCALFCAQGT